MRHNFASEREPALWRVLPTVEQLQTAWEKKAANGRFTRFHAALAAGLAKLMKYYEGFDLKPAIILSLGSFSFLSIKISIDPGACQFLTPSSSLTM